MYWGKRSVEVEDIVGEATVLRALKDMIGKEVALNDNDRDKASLVAQIRSAAERHETELPDGWKAEVARRIVVEWSTMNSIDVPKEPLDRAETLFRELTRRFASVEP